ncbi:MAG: hypothetical protein ABSE96_08750 [Terracidiphilus sp.]
MSLLHQEKPGELDDAARGESFTKGSSHLVWASIAAAVVVSIAIAIYVIAGEKPPVATGEVLEIWAHPMHSVTPAFDANGSSVSQESFDQVLVFTRVRLHNQSKQPLFLHQIMTNVTMADGTVNTSFAATASQYERVFLAYPTLARWHNTPLSSELTLEPGQTAEGTFVSSFRMAKDQWDARKALDFTFGFRYQPEVKVNASGAVIDR